MSSLVLTPSISSSASISVQSFSAADVSSPIALTPPPSPLCQHLSAFAKPPTVADVICGQALTSTDIGMAGDCVVKLTATNKWKVQAVSEREEPHVKLTTA